METAELAVDQAVELGHDDEATPCSKICFATHVSATTSAAERRKVARINANVGKGAMLWGRYPEARHHLRTALALAEAEHLARLRYSILLSQADLDWFTGRWDGLAERVADLADADRDRPVVYLATVRLAARLDAATGRPHTAEQQFRLALDEAARLGAFDETMEVAAEATANGSPHARSRWCDWWSLARPTARSPSGCPSHQAP